MAIIERNPAFTNKLVGESSLYLKQHAYNPVFWYPWGREAIERARKENKPILLSIGYSTCYWCHVMEREVFENLSIASLMNRLFINIKVDREQHPAIDELYMVARQLMTHEGGWPNNVFLTPQLQPFYAGGTYGAEDAYGKPAFPRLLEWLNYSWTTQEETVRSQAQEITKAMQPFVTYTKQTDQAAPDIAARARELCLLLGKHHDEQSGGFYQAPKFPNECYLQFLLAYHRYSGDVAALNIAAHTLGKMAAGGIYDHVGCGFHRYAVDKAWMVPHFEKMLYNQAMLARCYTDAFSATGNHYFADIARSILDFVSAPLTDGHGAFLAAIDAETDQVEGAFYAWTAEEIQSLLTPEEANFFVHFFALADIPAFPGHKHPDGQVIIMRKPLDQAAVEGNMPYLELAAMVAHVMNKLLAARNQRKAPSVDDKVIISWNGLMIDAYAQAGRVLGQPRYTQMADRAARFLLEYAIDQDTRLCRVVDGGKPSLDASLEDYAYLIKGLISLHRAAGDASMLEAATMLAGRAEDLFADESAPGFFTTTSDDPFMLIRMKSYEDSTLPCPNATMIENLVALAELTGQQDYRQKAQQMIDHFLARTSLQPESSSMLAAALASLEPLRERPTLPTFEQGVEEELADEAVRVECSLVPEDILPGEKGELSCRLFIRSGFHIQSSDAQQAGRIATQCDLQGQGVSVEAVHYPPASAMLDNHGIYQSDIEIRIRFSLSPQLPIRPPMKLRLRYQPCDERQCYPLRDVVLSV